MLSSVSQCLKPLMKHSHSFLTYYMKHLYLRLSFTFFSFVMIVACEPCPLLVVCGRAAWNKSQKSLIVCTAGLFARKLTSFALCCYVIGLFNRLQGNHKYNRKECGSDVSSRFCGGSVVWHPKKWLRRRLGILWRFSPPTGPRHGSIWENWVKACKHHLKRIVGESELTFEEMATILCQIKACFNSRPLYTVRDSNDNDGIAPLMPGHFLTNRPLEALSDQVSTTPTSTLKQWQLCQALI